MMVVRKWPTQKSFRIALKTIITTLLVPVLPVATVPFLILRQWNKLSVKKFHKDSHRIGERLKPVAQVLVHDTFIPSPQLNLVFCWFGEGSLSVESLREIFTNNILGSTVDDGKSSSKLEYPELTSHIKNYGGYFYYKKIPDFDIKKYIRPYHQEPTEKRSIRESDLKQIVAHLTTKGWPQGESPWEVLLVNNYVDHDTTTDTDEAKAPNFKSKTVIIFRTHHFLADGYSLQRIFKLMSTGKFKNIADINMNEDLIMTWKKIFFAPYLLPYNMAVLMDEFSHLPPTSWSIPPEKQGKAGRNLYTEWSGDIPLEALKRIKNTYGVSFQAVLSCVVGGAIQKLLEGMKKEVPQMMPTIFAFPRPGHPGGLANHWGSFPICLPVRDPDPVKRLKSSEAVMQKITKSPLPSLAYLLYNFVGLFPSGVTQLVTKTDIGNSIAFSPLSMFEGVNYIGSCRAISIAFTFGSGWGSASTSIAACSSYEKIRFAITIDQLVHTSKENLTRFDEFIQADIKALLKNI